MNIKLAMIELKKVRNGVELVFRPTVIWDEKDVILIDTGYPGHLKDIQNGLEELSIGKITKVIITHQDHDHLGSLHEIIENAESKIEVFSHALTKPYIEGEEPLTKLKCTVPKVAVTHTIEDGDVLPFCGGLRVIFTPGHTPDHISLYHQESKTLITGDALTAIDGKIGQPNPQYTLDMEGAFQSINKFLDLEIQRAFCFHGGICEGQVIESIERLIEEYSKG
jgi:glyoxylase-like metal-dependent hydrolase (beta-lactamase superfamily II)